MNCRELSQFCAIVPICRLLALGVLATLVGCDNSPPVAEKPQPPAEAVAATADRPNVILISIDTLRPDHLGCYGYNRPTSPTIDSLAAAGVIFDDASTTAPWTPPAHATMLTGLYPSRHGLRPSDFRIALTDKIRTDAPFLPEILKQHGYHTQAFINDFVIGEAPGFNRGFDGFVIDETDTNEPHPSQIAKLAVDHLNALPAGKPFFMFLHFYDVHSGYTSLPEYERQFVQPYEGKADGTSWQLMLQMVGTVTYDQKDVEHLIDLYVAGIRQVDDQIKLILDALEQKDLAKNTYVVLTSDHGEQFLAHGLMLHGPLHYQETNRVPMIVRGPKVPAGLRVDDPVSLVDLMPTILGFAGLPAPYGAEGLDLGVTWTRPDKPLPSRLLFAEADFGGQTYDMRRTARDGRYKLHFNLLSKDSELYDLSVDPHELNNIAAEQPTIVRALNARLKEFMEIDLRGDPGRTLTKDEMQRLKSLGYIR